MDETRSREEAPEPPTSCPCPTFQLVTQVQSFQACKTLQVAIVEIKMKAGMICEMGLVGPGYLCHDVVITTE